MDSYDKVLLARDGTRPNLRHYISRLFTDFFEQKGDRSCRDDGAIIGGIALLEDRPITVLGHQKGASLEENVQCNFGMPGPEGYRKALRIMEQAEKFGRPILTFVDTPGAYPGMEAEERGQGEAIARCLMAMGQLRVPILTVVIGEGGSGGALAISVADRIWMLENAVYSVLSPEGFATILWKDASRAREASELMKLTANDLKEAGVCDRVIPEPPGGVKREHERFFTGLRRLLTLEVDLLCKQNINTLLSERYDRYRALGAKGEKI
ncbi:MAG TPA: acetyl-CoA carboxylase carboxyltransferase subunit alpha [Firmicutes bacterium]|nr:acetyl-CoA carboxylase carboxyltransferase subunit alpha [Bacillota bacterium]